MQTLTLKHGDCVQRMAEMAEASIDAIVCDPPYGLKFMQTKERTWDDLGEGASQREWHKAWLAQAYRVLVPSGVLYAFSGTRTHHHLAAAMSTVGFTDLTIRAWGYATGFPKSLDVSKAIDATILTGGSNSKAIRKAISERPGEARETATLPNNGVMSGDRQGGITNDNAATDAARQWQGWGTALKPAWEPVVCGRKPA